MADYEIKPNTFVLFRNKSKTKDTSPDFSGTYYDDDCKPHFLDAWSKSMRGNEEKFLSGKRGNQKTKSSGAASPGLRAAAKRLDDEVPF